MTCDKLSLMIISRQDLVLYNYSKSFYFYQEFLDFFQADVCNLAQIKKKIPT